MDKHIYVGLGTIGAKTISVLWQNEILDANSMMNVFCADADFIAEPEFRIHKYGLPIGDAASEKLENDLSLLQIDGDDRIVLHFFFSLKEREATAAVPFIQNKIEKQSPQCLCTLYYLFSDGEGNADFKNLLLSDDTAFDVYVCHGATEENMKAHAALSLSFVEGLPEKQNAEILVKKTDE